MATWSQLRARVTGDLRRSNLVTEADNAIKDAIAEAAHTRFWFNEFGSSFMTNVSTHSYDNGSGLSELDSATYVVGSNHTREIERVSYDEYLRMVDDISLYSHIGAPEAIAFFNNKFFLYPFPDGDYNIIVRGYGTVTYSTNDTSTSVWTNEAELYIRELAKRNLLRDVIRDYGEAAVREKIAEEYKQMLIDKTNLLQYDTQLKATQF